MKNEPKSNTVWQNAGRETIAEFRSDLIADLGKVKKTMRRGLDKKKPIVATHNGKITDKMDVDDGPVQAMFVKIYCDVLGLKAPEKRQHSLDRDGFMAIVSVLPPDYVEAIMKLLPRHFDNAD